MRWGGLRKITVTVVSPSSGQAHTQGTRVSNLEVGRNTEGPSPVQLSIIFITNESAVERAELGKDPGYALQPHCTPVLL